jgi:hypothetical protein
LAKSRKVAGSGEMAGKGRGNNNRRGFLAIEEMEKVKKNHKGEEK